MKDMTATEIGKRLVEAFQLNCRPICVFGTDDMAEEKVPLGKVDRCVARAIFALSAKKGYARLLFRKGSKGRCMRWGARMARLSPDPSEAQVSHIRWQSRFHERGG